MNLTMIWEIVVNAIESLLFLYLLTHQLEYSRHSKRLLAIGIIIKIAGISMLNFAGVSATYTLVLSLFYDISYTCLSFTNNVTEKIMWGSSYVLVAIMADKISFWFANNFTEYPLEQLLEYGPIRIYISLIYLLTCAVIVLTLSRWRKKNFFLPLKFQITLILLICLGVIATEQILTLIVEASTAGIDPHIITSLQIIGYIIIFILVSFLIFLEYLGTVFMQNEKLRRIEMVYDLEKKHYESIDTTMSALKSWKHDYKIQLQVILELIVAHKYEELKDYILSLEHNLVQTARFVTTGNHILDAILSVKLLECQNSNITITYEIFISQNLPMEEITFASLIGNMFENAMEACRKVDQGKEKYIRLVIKPVHDMLYINLENSSPNDYVFSPDGSLRTSKTGGMHGIGLKSIQSIAQSQNGFCSTSAQPDTFTITVMLPNGEEERS